MKIAYRSLWIFAFFLASCQPGHLRPALTKTGSVGIPLVEVPQGRDDEIPATLVVGLKVSQPQNIQALPVSWDTATIYLEHPTALTQPRLLTLTKGVDIIASGSVFVASSAFGILHPKSGYTLTVSLWNGGISGTLAGERQQTVNLLSGVNNITIPIQVYPALALDSFAPTSGSPGNLITLNGLAFSVLPLWDKVSLDELPASILSVASTSLSVAVPEVAPSGYLWQIQVGAAIRGKAGFTALGTIGSRILWVTLISHQYDPAIAIGSNQYLSVWYDDRTGLPDIFGKRLDGNGNPVGSDIAINSDGGTQQHPHVAYSPSRDQYLVIWQDSVNTSDIRGQLVNADGTLSGSPFSVYGGAGAQINPHLTYNTVGNRYAVTWTDNRGGNNDIYAQEINADGSLVGSSIPIETNTSSQDHPDIAYSAISGKYLLVWDDARASRNQIWGRIMNPDGSFGAPPFLISTETNRDQLEPVAAVDGASGNFFVAWKYQTNPNQIVGQAVSSSGTLIGSGVVLCNSSSAKNNPRLAYESWRQKFVAIWCDDRNGTDDVYGQYFSADGLFWGSNFAIATGANDQSLCDLAVNPLSPNALVSYQDSASNGNIYGQLIR
ncbi:MAG TPA: hypothetical protein DD435_10410 [Cyanobacteria bacterium UBA8530]|nr:hypothetical protein [Cyanobacteria bacterium UBA8530]